jgi:hypothetical protein
MAVRPQSPHIENECGLRCHAAANTDSSRLLEVPNARFELSEQPEADPGVTSATRCLYGSKAVVGGFLRSSGG